MSKYLSPKADLTFKKVFGEHKALTISFLNALLCFDDQSKIESIEYQTSEMLPDTPTKKYSIVDVKCTDDRGRQFIVEMQMVWYSDFLKRVLHNTTKTYSRQLEYGKPYRNLMPVYTLCLLNENFTATLVDGKDPYIDPDDPDYFHSYKMLEEGHPERVIEGLNIVLVELQKFKPTNMAERRMMVLWLRFLTEIGENTVTVAPELLEEEEIKEALNIVERSAYTDAQMAAYERFWEEVSVNRNFDPNYLLDIGRAEGDREACLRNAKNLKSLGVDVETISKATGLSNGEIEKL